ncbi:hypothetical protein EDD15DRAFT_653028 [Pisolithus albus]|nr:hypothetical protein EDD15DRAFT_653028 [Pisolithus albus]
MDNSQNQNPCVVAAYTMSVCWPGPFDVPALGPGIYYYHVNGPPTACECTTVAYCLISACAACQNGTYFNWPFWSANCSAVYVGYPFTIPIGTVIPQWAYQNSSGDFNIGLAQEVADSPESVAPSAPVTTSSTTASPTPPPSSFTSSATLPSTQPLTTSSPSTQKGAIVGGVVGGGVGLAAAAAVTWFFVCHRRKIRLPRADDDE